MPQKKTPIGDPAREAIDSLRGYVYQIYQSALAWTEIKGDEFLFLEVAEDFAVAAANALEAVQVKETAGRVTINSDDIPPAQIPACAASAPGSCRGSNGER